MNKYAFALFFIFFCLPSSKASVRPEVSVIPVEVRVDFEISEPVTECGPLAAGCTIPMFFQPEIRIDCKTGRIVPDFKKFEFLVQIANRYKKGTTEFDHILKHELTHVALHKGVVEKFYRPIASAVLLRFEKSQAEMKSCRKIKKDVSAVFYDYISRIIKEGKKQNALIDGDENYSYQWNQVWQAKRNEAVVENRPAPAKKAAADATVDVVNLETRRRYNITAPDNVAVDEAGRPDAEGTGLLKNLSAGASLELDRANATVDCRTGAIRLELGYSSTISFNEKQGTRLYDYLTDALTRRVAELERHAESAEPKIRQDVERTYGRLAAAGLACKDVRARLNERMGLYRRQVSEEMRRKNKALGDAVPLWRDFFEKDAAVYAAARRRAPLPQEEKEAVPQTAVSERPPEPRDKTETAAKENVSEKIVTGKTDKFYISFLKYLFSAAADKFEFKKRFDNILENMKNTYNRLISESGGSMPENAKAVKKSK